MLLSPPWPMKCVKLRLSSGTGDLGNIRFGVQCGNISWATQEIFLTWNMMPAPPSVRTWFPLDHNMITCGAVLRCEDPVHPRKLKPGFVWARRVPQDQGSNNIWEWCGSSPPELTRWVLSSLWTWTQKAFALLPEQVPKNSAFVCSHYLQKFLPKNCLFQNLLPVH